ncbi:MAG: hypothetical protein ACOYLH_12425, partial [Flavobacteriales bacterium]
VSFAQKRLTIDDWTKKDIVELYFGEQRVSDSLTKLIDPYSLQNPLYQSLPYLERFFDIPKGYDAAYILGRNNFVWLENDTMRRVLQAVGKGDELDLKTWDPGVPESELVKQGVVYSMMSFAAIDEKKEYFIFDYSLLHVAGDSSYLDPNRMFILDLESGKDQLFEFDVSEELKGYDLILEVYNNFEQLPMKFQYGEHQYLGESYYNPGYGLKFPRISVTWSRMEYLQNWQALMAMRDYEFALATKNWSLDRKVLVSHLYYHDIDGDGKSEFWQGFFSNGKLAHLVVYKNVNGVWTKVKPTDKMFDWVGAFQLTKDYYVKSTKQSTFRFTQYIEREDYPEEYPEDHNHYEPSYRSRVYDDEKVDVEPAPQIDSDDDH